MELAPPPDTSSNLDHEKLSPMLAAQFLPNDDHISHSSLAPYSDQITRAHLDMPSLSKALIDVSGTTEMIRKGYATKSELRANKLSLETLSMNLWQREHNSTNERLKGATDTLLDEISRSMSHKADWDVVREHFGRQTNLLLKSHTHMILDEIERVVINTLRAAGLTNLKDLAPSENQLMDFNFRLQKLDIEIGHVGIKQRSVERVVEHMDLEQTQKFAMFEKTMEEKFRSLSAQIFEELGQVNTKTKKLIEEIAHRVFQEKISVIQTTVHEHTLQNKEFVAELKGLKESVDTKFKDHQRQISDQDKKCEKLTEKLDQCVQSVEELRAQVQDFKRLYTDITIKLRQAEDRIEKLKEQMKRDGIDLQRKIKELNSFFEAAKAQQQEDRKQMQATMEKVLAKEDKMEKELVKMKDALGKTVSYGDFSKLAEKVTALEEEGQGTKIQQLTEKVHQIEDRVKQEHERVRELTGKFLSTREYADLEIKVSLIEKDLNLIGSSVKDKVTGLHRNINFVKSELTGALKQQTLKFQGSLKDLKGKIEENRPSHYKRMRSLAVTQSLKSLGSTSTTDAFLAETLSLSQNRKERSKASQEKIDGNSPKNMAPFSTTCQNTSLDFWPMQSSDFRPIEAKTIDMMKDGIGIQWTPRRIGADANGRPSDSQIQAVDAPNHDNSAGPLDLQSFAAAISTKEKDSISHNQTTAFLMASPQTDDPEKSLCQKEEKILPSQLRPPLSGYESKITLKPLSVDSTCFVPATSPRPITSNARSHLQLKDCSNLQSQVEVEKSSQARNVTDVQKVQLKIEGTEEPPKGLFIETSKTLQESISQIEELEDNHTDLKRELIFSLKAIEKRLTSFEVAISRTLETHVRLTREKIEINEGSRGAYLRRQLRLLVEGMTSKEEYWALQRIVGNHGHIIEALKGDVNIQRKDLCSIEPKFIDISDCVRHYRDRLFQVEKDLQNFRSANSALLNELRRARKEKLHPLQKKESASLGSLAEKLKFSKVDPIEKVILSNGPAKTINSEGLRAFTPSQDLVIGPSVFTAPLCFSSKA